MFRALLSHTQEGYTNGTCYIACMLCELAATRVGVELVLQTTGVADTSSTPNLVAGR
jgi:hypothetical protein